MASIARSFSTVSACLCLSQVLMGCINGPVDEEIVAQEHAVQTAYEGNYDIVLAEGQSLQAHSVGAIRFQNTNGTYAECGATFISPRYAVTAAHCVSSTDLPINAAVTVQQVKLNENISPLILYLHSLVSGSWPDLSHYLDLTSTSYKAWDYTCYVRRRCHTPGAYDSYQYGRDNCAEIEGIHDLALLECPSRSLSADYLATMAASDLDQEVEVWWFHEYVNAATNSTVSTDTFDHYTIYSGRNSRTSNWHYTDYHQLLPLVSRTFANGDPYKVVGIQNQAIGGTYVPAISKTNVPVCHGTSGSGAILGSSIVGGPVVTGGLNQGNTFTNRLCDSMNAVSHTGYNSGYLHSSITAQVISFNEVLLDRQNAL